MKTAYYKIGGLTVALTDGRWEIPCLRPQQGDGELLEASTILVRIVDGEAVDPNTDGPAASLNDWDRWEIHRGDKLMGWGDHDCEYSYTIKGCRISGPALERVAEWTGLKLPATA